MFAFWAYILYQANEEEKLGTQLTRKDRTLAMRAIEFIRAFAKELDGETQKLAVEFTGHVALEAAVDVIEKGEAVDKRPPLRRLVT